MPRNGRTDTGDPALRVRGNDWGVAKPSRLGAWEPTLSASIVVPVLGDPSTLDAVLAALAAQSYPERLLEVLVVDAGSGPPVALPDVRPKNTRVVTVTRTVPGRAAALDAGTQASDGDVVCLLDRDVVACAEFVEAKLRWHHVMPDAVVFGALNDRDVDDLHGAGHEAFLAGGGRTLAVSRALYREAGGVDPALHLGEDVELSYRLAQAGSVYVLEPAARGLRLDAPQAPDSDLEAAVLADLMPLPRRLRACSGWVWPVPLVQAVIRVNGESYDIVRGSVDRLLAAGEEDLHVLVCTDESRDLALARTAYRSQPRVRFGPLAGPAPSSAQLPEARSPFVLDLPAYCGLGVSTVGALVDQANSHQSGLLRVVIPGVAPASNTVSLWRTAAVSRARRVLRPGEPLEDAVDDVAGLRWVDGYEYGVVDLRTLRESVMRCPPRWRTEDVDLAGAVAQLRRQAAKLTQERNALVAQRDALAEQRDETARQRDVALAERDDARAALTFSGVARRYARGLRRRMRRR